MPDRNWARVQQVFAEALEQPPDRRDDYVSKSCAAQPDVLAEVRSLLEAREDSGAFLDEPALASVRIAPEVEPGAAVGRSFASYRAVEFIAQGGMGEVYLGARDDDEFERRVAIKLMRQGVADERAVESFRAERQLLASLTHPNIAQLLDGGTDENGLPFFVLEYVEGRALDVFCDEEQLSLTERLQLFRKVCDGVDHAHKQLVVHGDIKPSNILVFRGSNGDAIPKLVDFGLATLLESASTDGSPDESGRPHWFTPSYASPEQVCGDRVTTASDVYSLGALLYRLVAGRPPHEAAARRPGQLARELLTQTPEPPSAHATESIPHDLDAVIMKGLAKPPTDRHSSARAFEEEIARFLGSWPVQSVAPTMGYLARKLVRRRPVRALMSAAVVLLTLVGTASVLWQAKIARASASRTARVNHFLQGIIGAVDPLNRGSSGDYLTVLRTARPRLDSEFANDPLMRASLLDTYGVAFLHLGHNEEAKRDLTLALEIRETRSGVSEAELADTVQHMGELSYELAKLDEAEAAYSRALDLRRRALGVDHPDYAASLTGLGLVALQRGEHERARELHEQALEILLNAPDQTATDRAFAWNNLGVDYIGTQAFDDARRALDASMQLLESQDPPDGAGVSLTLQNLGSLEEAMGNIETALDLYVQSLEICRKTFGDDHPETAVLLQHVGSSFAFAGDPVGGEPYIREAVEMWERVDSDSTRSDYARTELAGLVYSRGDYEEAVQLYEDLLASYSRRGDDDVPYLSTLHMNLGNALSALKRYGEAIENYGLSAQLREELYGDRHGQVAQARGGRGRALQFAERLEEAEVDLRQALAIRREVFTEPTWQLVDSLANLAELLLMTGELDEATELADEAVAVAADALPADHWLTSNARSVLGECLVEHERFEEAETQLIGAWECLRDARGEGYSRTRATLERNVLLYDRWGREADAALWRGRR